MRKDLRKRLGKEWLFCDGGAGTILQDMGLKGGELPETWNLIYPEKIKQLYDGYIEAGSNIFNTNTFGANRLKYPDNLKQIVETSVKIACEERDKSKRCDDVYVALDVGPTGKLLQPMGDLSFDEAVDIFGEVIKIGESAGADLIFIETMSDSYETKAAVLAAKENSSLPVFVTNIYDTKGKMLTGGTVESMVAMLEGLHVDALGLNCGLGPKEMYPIAEDLVRYASVPVIVNPNAGLPRTEGSCTVFDVEPEEFTSEMEKIAKLGVNVMGGCCGTTPAHIRRMIEKVRNVPFKENTPKSLTVVTSFSQAVEIGNKPVIIGERINPTGKKKFQQALRDNDIEYILQQGLEQEDAGADILDVNVGIPKIDEAAMMRNVMTRLQGVTPLPLQIDTADEKALEAGLRYYNGKPMVNSTNGKEEIMSVVMPLVAKYGGVLVGLCIDEDGIPKKADKRIEIARKIYANAEKYGIPKKDIIIDGLAMTVSSEPDSANETLETLRRIKEELHGHSILGVSNISFGLPERMLINSFFFAMAMQEGLSAAIMNPNNGQMMSAYRSFLALTNQDPQCMGYINAYADAAITVVSENKKKSGTGVENSNTGVKTEGLSASANETSELSHAVKRGITETAAQCTRKLLENNVDPFDIINNELIPALDEVGKGFESGSLFLPQLLMSAEAAKKAFAVLKDSMQGKPQQVKGKIIMATVKGDIHDIGKNIVKVMLENYGYDVIDLGKDVPPETILDAAVSNDVKLVGLSALMTTTVVSMEETIRLLHEKKPGTKVIVGGAVMTQQYADEIGADAYAADAMGTVRYADSVFC